MTSPEKVPLLRKFTLPPTEGVSLPFYRSSNLERWKICLVHFFSFLLLVMFYSFVLFFLNTHPVLFPFCVSKFGFLRGGEGAFILRDESGLGLLITV